MREIKFRAWIAKSSKMVYEGWNGDIFYSKREIFAQGEDAEVMQYTGLKDKAGKEIYELHEINHKFRVVYKFNRYILQDISNSDIFEEILQNGQYEITGEYSPLEKN